MYMAHEDRIKSLEKRMEKVEKNQDRDSLKIDQMYRGLFGDSKINYEGLIESNKKHTAYLNKIDPVIDDLRDGIERKKNRKRQFKASIKWIAIVGSAISAWLLSMTDLIKKFYHFIR